jgi:PPOX class probable FMN-dependent enzyme
MADVADMVVVSSPQELRDLVGLPTARVADKVRTTLDDVDRQWLAASPFLLIATADADGRCDVSPRGGPAGWVQVLDDHRLALADAPGNRRIDSLRNILANPHCGLLFLVPDRSEVLRVNGSACETDDPRLLDGIPGRPAVALGVTVDEVFTHCAKALIRSKVWKAETWPPPDALPSLAQMLRDHAAINGRRSELGEVEDQVATSIAERMW